jgi:hypoxanthine phosphoribosyltransferase
MKKEEGIEKILISQQELQDKVAELGEKISRDYEDKKPVLISILKGAFYFLADLTRCIHIPIHMDFLAIGRHSSEPNKTGVVKITKDLEISITGRHVLIVEDIIDTGLTLGYLIKYLQAQNPESVKVCTLLDNPTRRLVNLPVKYTGFTIPDVFLVGYGLDYKEDYRHLNYIAEFKEE